MPVEASGTSAVRHGLSCRPVNQKGIPMSITVPNTRRDNPMVTLFAQLSDGSYVAKRMTETDVPYTREWDNELDQVAVYIDPDESQLQAILAALNDGRLDYQRLQEYGAADSGSSTFDI
jgi:hypothetical protein